ncbi:MAG: YifB family Mg chelatase-like AAA ATPase [Lachnospiraceae bacterium]|nr:YifB family Mg chelatase-like AAA ATPase [Lachnospiraceae bacterium]
MFSTVISGALLGIDSTLIRVETDISSGLPGLDMVGYLGSEVREAGKRVRVAMRNCGFQIPVSRITVSFAPADLPKRGVVADLPVAIGILICMQVLHQSDLEDILVAGELGLDGEVRSIRGILPLVRQAKQEGIHTCIIPAENLNEGAVIQGIRVVGVQTLSQAVAYLSAPPARRDRLLPPGHVDLEALFRKGQEEINVDFSDIHGQETAKRVLEIAAAGFHNTLLSGPPGSGKSMLARRMPGILPPLTQEESMEVTSIYSVAGRLPPGRALITERPFLAPHHTITRQALVGGGTIPQPGIISLAHRSVLFLDELPEFGREIIDLLRQPLEDHQVTISRSSGSVTYPSRFLLLAAMNNCPCGFYPDLTRCTCSPGKIRKYLGRISGPILDRIDLCTEVPEIDPMLMIAPAEAESSRQIRERVSRAIGIQKERFRDTSFLFNADMDARAVEQFCPLDSEESAFILKVFEKYRFSVRTYHHILKTARTIADLDESPEIRIPHLAEAVRYRTAERGFLREPGKTEGHIYGRPQY